MLGLALFSLAMVGLNAYLVDTMAFPPGPVHLVLLLAYVPAGVLFLFWILAYEDYSEALSVLLLYLFLPGFPLLLIDLYLRFWQPVSRAMSWLQQTPS